MTDWKKAWQDMVIEIAETPAWIPPYTAEYEELNREICAMLDAAYRDICQCGADTLVGDLDNWKPIGILAAVQAPRGVPVDIDGHTHHLDLSSDETTRVSMLPDWAASARP